MEWRRKNPTTRTPHKRIVTHVQLREWRGKARTVGSAVREREKRMQREAEGKQKKEYYKEREEDERAAKANWGRHIEGAERRTINVRTTTSRWLVDQTRQIDHCGQNLHRDTQFEIIKSFVFPNRDIDMLNLTNERNWHN